MRNSSRSACVAVAALAALATACDRRQSPTGGGASAPQGTVPGAPPSVHLVADVSHGEWRMPAGDYGSLRYSTLDTITPANAMKLHVVTTFSTGIPHGHEGQPLVFGNTMYVVTPF